MAWDFCTKDQVTKVRYADPATIEDSWSDTVEAMIRRHTRSPGIGTSEVVTNELHSGDDTPILIVKKPPIYSVSELRISSSPVTSSDFVYFENYITLTGGKYFPKGVLNIAIDYTSGGDVDPIINMTAIAMIVAFLNFRERYGADTSLKWTNSEQMGEPTPNLNVGLTSHLYQIMRRMLERDRIRIR